MGIVWVSLSQAGRYSLKERFQLSNFEPRMLRDWKVDPILESRFTIMGLVPTNHVLIDHLLQQWHPPLDPSLTRIRSSPGTGSCSAPEKHRLLQTVIRNTFKACAFTAQQAVMICSSQLQQVEAQGSAKKKRWPSQVVFPCIFRQCLSSANSQGSEGHERELRRNLGGVRRPI